MEIPKIHEGEYRFCLILWDHEPVTAAQLAKLCLEQLGWKRTTTYTVIKRLGERGILKNENGLITALVSKDEAQAYEIDELVEKKFEGSLPTFIAAFTKRQDLSEHELDEVQQMIDRIRRGLQRRQRQQVLFFHGNQLVLHRKPPYFASYQLMPTPQSTLSGTFSCTAFSIS